MIKIILGTLFIIAGLGWFVLAAMAAGMASRATTRSENAMPFYGLLAVAFGIAILIWG